MSSIIDSSVEPGIDTDLIFKNTGGAERRATEMKKVMRNSGINPNMMSKKAESKMLEALKEVFDEDDDETC